MIKIDNNIPIPNAPHKSGAPFRYPWVEMQIGDSFLLSTRIKNAANSQKCQAQTKYGIKLCLRKTDEGYRVWRIA